MSDALPSEEALFEAALQLPPHERAAYLQDACGGDADLRARVETLLAAHDQAGTFLETPAVGEWTRSRHHDAATEKPGQKIGPYKLLEQIGEGGFGIVYLAEQEQPIRRKVALKIIKPGMDTRQVIARFEAERQALALMEHPNIAQVFDAGETESGRPYFVMELVRGVPITAYCDQGKLPLHERLELFTHVCQAVQHAHSKGIVHRDIKPSNILVTPHDGVPVVKVIDFGIAKAMGRELTDKTLFTGLAQVVGTPLYASPEQVALGGQDIDTRTDVYSLGVLLYELLTGTTPFEKERLQKAALEEIRRIVREEDPPRPSTRMTTVSPQSTVIAAQRASQPRRLAQVFRGELDWIVMKALEKDRARRYETPVAFAGDIGRYLANDPVEARPPTAVYRLGKFVRRHKWGATVAVAAVAVLLIIAVGSTLAARLFWTQDEQQRQLVVEKDGGASAKPTLASVRQGLVLHFTFDREEPGGIVTDASGTGNHGTVTNAHWTPDGKKGGAYEFRADNEMIQVPNHDSLNPANLTVAAWIKGTNIDGIWRRIIDKSQVAGEIVDEGYALSIAGDWKQYNLRGKATMEIGKIGWARMSTIVVMDGQWHQIVSTYDGVENILYVDGVRNAITRSTRGVPPTTRPVMIGAQSTVPANVNTGSFRGLIDEPMIWNRALSPAEVLVLFDPNAKPAAALP